MYIVGTDKLLTVSEVAQMLGVPVSWIYGRTRARGIERIPHIKLGKYLRFNADKVRGWVAQFQEN